MGESSRSALRHRRHISFAHWRGFLTRRTNTHLVGCRPQKCGRLSGGNTTMNETLTHALRLTELLETDLHRLSIESNDAISGLIADCAEHRLQLANKLRHIKQMLPVKIVNQHGEDVTRKWNPLGAVIDESDSEYLQHAEHSDANALAEYRSRVRFIGYCMCAVTTGAFAGIAYVAYQLLK